MNDEAVYRTAPATPGLLKSGVCPEKVGIWPFLGALKLSCPSSHAYYYYKGDPNFLNLNENGFVASMD